MKSYCTLRQQPMRLSSTYDTLACNRHNPEVFHNLWKNLWKTLIHDDVTNDTRQILYKMIQPYYSIITNLSMYKMYINITMYQMLHGIK